MRQAVAVIIPNPQSPHLVLSVSRKDNLQDYGLPGGKVDPGEDLRESAVREVFEETGLIIDPNSLTEIFAQVCKGKTDYHVTTFLTQFPKDGKVIQQDGEGFICWQTWDYLEQGSFGAYNKQLRKYFQPF